jgi:hypothetical protein
MSYYRTPEHGRGSRRSSATGDPWDHSIGPKSEDGKVRVSRNPYTRGGTRASLRELAWLLREQCEALKRIR